VKKKFFDWGARDGGEGVIAWRPLWLIVIK